MNRLGTAAGAVLALVALSATGACTNSGEPPSMAPTSTTVTTSTAPASTVPPSTPFAASIAGRHRWAPPS